MPVKGVFRRGIRECSSAVADTLAAIERQLLFAELESGQDGVGGGGFGRADREHHVHLVAGQGYLINILREDDVRQVDLLVENPATLGRRQEERHVDRAALHGWAA